MELHFIGAAQTVTGSMHLVRTSGGDVLLDCGLFQGTRREAYERNRDLEVPLRDVRAVVLSHAPIPDLQQVLAARDVAGRAEESQGDRRHQVRTTTVRVVTVTGSSSGASSRSTNPKPVSIV